MNQIPALWPMPDAHDQADPFAPIRANLFPAAHGAIGKDWTRFPWHRHNGAIQSWKPHSSQALAIDVFGAIDTAVARDTVLDALATAAGLPGGGPWTLELEWTDPANLLREKRSTQVDVLAEGARAILVIECKFTEPGGGCSQVGRIARGVGTGLRQCDGNYRRQVNPRNGVEARCALSGKGIRYWDVVPAVFDLDADTDHIPCPFRGDAFQWMRNMTLAHELGRVTGKAARCAIVYAAGGDFPAERKTASTAWLPPMATIGTPPFVFSYQAVIELAEQVAPDAEWRALRNWVDNKVALARTGAGRS